jgi:hypothetical protein
MELGAGQQSIDHWALGIFLLEWQAHEFERSLFFFACLLTSDVALHVGFGSCFRDFVRRFDTSVLFAQIGIFFFFFFFFSFFCAVHPVALFIHTLRERERERERDDDFSILAFMRLPYLSLRIEPLSWELIILCY